MIRLIARLLVLPWAVSLAVYKLTYKGPQYGRNRLEYMNPYMQDMIDLRRRSGYPVSHSR